MNEEKEVLNSKILLQYYINSKVAGNKIRVQYTPSSHGNCRNAEKSFFPLKKSTLDRFRSQVYQKSKRKIGNLSDAEMNANNDDKDYDDFPRSKKQLIDLSRSQLTDNEVGDILAYNEELGSNGIIWHHSDMPDDLWVLGTNVMTNELSNATKVLPISDDPTFNFGCYEVTPFTYRSVAFECKSKNVLKTWVPVTVIGPTIIQHTKFDETYKLAMRSIAKKMQIRNSRRDLHNNRWRTSTDFSLFENIFKFNSTPMYETL